jgi:lysozyme
MKINAEGLSIIKEFEGLSLKRYLCPAGVWTQGYGRTSGITKSSPEITKATAEQWLKQDAAEFERGVLALVTNRKMNANQFSALVSLGFNIGLGNLKRSTLLRLFNQGLVIEASEQFGRWNKAGGKTLRGLSRRREAERKLFLKPIIVT